MGMIGREERYLVVSCRAFAGILPNQNIKSKQTGFRKWTDFIPPEVLWDWSKNPVKFRSGKGIAGTGEDILILENSRTYEFIFGKLIVQKNRFFLEIDVDFLEEKLDEQKIWWRAKEGPALIQGDRKSVV